MTAGEGDGFPASSLFHNQRRGSDEAATTSDGDNYVMRVVDSDGFKFWWPNYGCGTRPLSAMSAAGWLVVDRWAMLLADAKMDGPSWKCRLRL
ncbi:hypothetical protein Dimus_013392 [Dionaea muscipula]